MESIEILEKVMSFYDSAWLKLMFFISAIIIIVGVIIPIITQYYQHRTFKLREEKIRADIIKQIEDVIDNKFDNVINNIDNRMKKNLEESEKKLNYLYGGVYLIQGNFYNDQKSYSKSTKSLINSLDYFVQAGDEGKAQQVLKLIIDICLPELTNEIVDELAIDSISLNGVVAFLDKHNQNNRYAYYIRKFKQKIKELENE